MSFKSFFEHIGEWFKENLGKAATWEQAASTALKVSAPLLDEVIALTAGTAAATKVQGVIAQVQADMAGSATTITEAGSATGGLTIQSFLGSVTNNLGTLLTDADVKNTTEFSKIENTIKTVIGEVQVVASAMPKPAPAPVPVPAPVEPPARVAVAEPPAPEPPAPAVMAAAAGASEAAPAETAAPVIHLPNQQK